MRCRTMAGFFGRWLDNRLHLQRLRTFLAHKTVPIHRHSIWYYCGGVTLFLFGLQVVTGILLLLYYRPTQEAAFERSMTAI